METPGDRRIRAAEDVREDIIRPQKTQPNECEECGA